MSDAARRLLDMALSSPQFMAQVREAVLESPIVKAKDEEIARLTRERDEARRQAELYPRAIAERGADLVRAEEAESSLAAARDVLPPFVAALDGLMFHRAEDGTTTVTGKAVDDFDAWRGFVDALIKVRALAAALAGGSHG